MTQQKHFFVSIILITTHVHFKQIVLGAPNQYAIIDGDILLGAIFPVHGSDKEWDSTQQCGSIQEEDGIQALESFLYTIDRINDDPSLLPGIRLGAVALDSCDSTAHALEQSVDFVKLLITRISGDGDGGMSYTCEDGSRPQLVPGHADFHKIVGVVGASSSTVTLYVANLLQLFKMPQISFLSTSPDLSNSERFPYFQRTVPSDLNQAQAIIELLKQKHWTYISAVYEDSNYGLKGFSELEKRAEDAGICFALRFKIQVDQHPDSEFYEKIVARLHEKQEARVVFLFLDSPRARELFKAVNASLSERRGRDNRLIWIGSDAWSGRQYVVEGLGHVVENAITVQPLAERLPGFDEYFTSLNPHNNERNPWFPEFWAKHFHCEYGKHPGPESVDELGKRNKRVCTGQERISPTTGYSQQMYFHFIKDATYAFAHALTDMHAKYCGVNFTGLCPALEPERLNSTALLSFIKKVNFTDESSGRQFTFVNGVDGPPRYTYMHFHKTTNSKYRWQPVGNYSGVIGEPLLDLSADFLRDLGEYPASSCREECQFGQMQVRLKDNSCCWVCTNCSENQYLSKPDQCDACAEGTWPNSLHNACVPLPLVYMSHVNAWAIGPCVLSVIGMVLCVLVGVVFHLYRETPVIKASGRELSLVLLAGIFLSYLSPLIFVAQPSPATCAITRILLGFCYALCYAAILTKTNRIARIFFHDPTSAHKAKFTDPRSSLIIVSCFTSVEVVILIVWLIAIKPDTDLVYPTQRGSILLICAGASGVGYLIALAYPLLLIILCTIYAVKTRKTPDGFNEARYIAFTNYTTCVLWLAFVPMYIATPTHDIRVFTLCMAVSLSGTVQLACLFMPKVYTVLWHPEKNTREAVMTKRRSMSNTSGWSSSQMIYGENNVHLTVPASDHLSSGIVSMESVYSLSQAHDVTCTTCLDDTHQHTTQSAAKEGHNILPQCILTNGSAVTATESYDIAQSRDGVPRRRASSSSASKPEIGEQNVKDGENTAEVKDISSQIPLYPSWSDPSSLCVTPSCSVGELTFVTSTPRAGAPRDGDVIANSGDHLSKWRSLREIHSAPNSRPRSPLTRSKDNKLEQTQSLNDLVDLKGLAEGFPS